MATFQIDQRPIGSDFPVYVIAEMSGNHNHDFDKAMAIVEAAHEAGADAIKLQTYTADTITIDCREAPFLVPGGTLWAGQTLYDLYKEAYTPWEWQPKLKARADELGMHLFSSPFDATAVDFLERMQVPAHKIASFEMTDLPLLRKVAATGKPVIMSTGMATLAEIGESVETLRANGCRDLALLKCCSSYPAAPEQMNLRTIPHLGQAFDVVSGLSDHTMDLAVPVTAVALGARIIEKHFTLRRADGGADSAFSLEPHEFRDMVHAVHTSASAMGRISYTLSESELVSRGFRRSLFVTSDVAAGQPFTADNVRVIRPGNGLEPKHYEMILQRRASRDLHRGEPLGWDMIQ